MYPLDDGEFGECTADGTADFIINELKVVETFIGFPNWPYNDLFDKFLSQFDDRLKERMKEDFKYHNSLEASVYYTNLINYLNNFKNNRYIYETKRKFFLFKKKEKRFPSEAEKKIIIRLEELIKDFEILLRKN